MNVRPVQTLWGAFEEATAMYRLPLLLHKWCISGLYAPFMEQDTAGQPIVRVTRFRCLWSRILRGCLSLDPTIFQLVGARERTRRLIGTADFLSRRQSTSLLH